jgi:signal transduction histidine kinase/ActR/RegA family two-component response regulator
MSTAPPSSPSSRWIAWAALAVFVAVTAGAMPQLATSLLSTNGFMPHGYCYRWEPALLWMHVASDALIAGAYFSIPVALATFVRRRGDLPFNWLYLLFAIFIVACGVNHLMEIWLLWNPHYWLAGVLKAVTAAASVPTAIAAVLLIPVALRIPSFTQLERAKGELEQEVVRRRDVERALRAAQAELEARFDSRTSELDRVSGDLRSSNALLDTMFQQAPLGIGVWDLDLRCIRANAALARGASGLVSLRAPDRAESDVRQEAVNADVVKALRSARDTGEPLVDCDVAVPGTDGSRPRLWQVSYFPVVSDGAVRAIASLWMDVTERRRIESERAGLLHAAQTARAEAELANRSKDEFLAMVSHELRTPLQAMSGWLQLVQSDRLTPDQVRHALERIARNVRSQTRLIEDLVDLSRIVAGKLSLQLAQVEPSLVVAEAVEAVRPNADARSQSLRFSVEGTLPTLRADADRLRQVVSNLLGNAMKFTPDGGTITVGLRREGDGVRIDVTDTGIGIEADLLPLIFERYRQGARKPVISGNGLGLGLSIVRHVVELHGGHASARSDGPGRGATFSLWFPREAPDREAVAGVRDGGRTAAGLDPRLLADRRVLIVEDATDARQTLTVGLELMGAQVRGCASAEAALDELERWRPELIVSDIGLPGMSGYAFVERVLERHPDLPVIALTAYGDADDRRRALDAGFALHLTKPIRIDEVATYIARLVDAGPPADSAR